MNIFSRISDWYRRCAHDAQRKRRYHHTIPTTISGTNGTGETSKKAYARAGAPTSSRGPSLVAAWKERLVQGFDERDFKHQVALYSAHHTHRDYLFNGIGQIAQGLMFPALTIVASQLSSLAAAGQFSFCFVLAQLLGFIGLFGVRTYQVSDIEELDSFAAYQVHRIIVCLVMLGITIAFLMVRHLSSAMTLMCSSLVAYKGVEALADVFEGRLQQYDKLYLAGISQTIRCFFPLVIFIATLALTRHIPSASLMLFISSLACLGLVTFPLTKFETPASRPWNMQEIKDLFIECLPAFLGQFLFSVVDALPKFVMEGVLGYEQQFYYNALSFPAMAVLLVGALIYRPRLVRLSVLWVQEKDARHFDRQCLVIALALIAASACLIALVAHWGAAINGYMYGVSFQALVLEQNVMVCAGVCALMVDFVFQLLTIVRAQAQALFAYLLSVLIELVITLIATLLWGFAGTVWAFATSMMLLLVLMCLQYVRSRKRVF